MHFKNIILVGMPGVGKSTIGVLLAKRIGWSFTDTDLLIQAGEAQSLQKILETKGMVDFCAIEERYILALSCKRHVIATGGSVIYGKRAMAHLKRLGFILHLDLSPEILKERLNNISNRGVVMAEGLEIKDLYAERGPLYKKYADEELFCAELTPDEIVNQLENKLHDHI